MLSRPKDAKVVASHNADSTHSQTETLRKTALALFRAAVERADPAEALRRYLLSNPLPHFDSGRCFVLAVGKAALPMMRAALESLQRVDDALVVTNSENAAILDGVTVTIGAHPVPDESSITAGRAVLAMLKKAGPGDRVVALISGGGSALVAAPSQSISLRDYARANELLLASGLGITQLNLVRQQIDRLKGGGLLRHAAPATVHAYLLSDVVGDDLRVIASGLTASPIGTRREAADLLRAEGLWHTMPASVRQVLQDRQRASDVSSASNHLIGSNLHSLEAILERVPKGTPGRIVSDRLDGTVSYAAERILCAAEASRGPIALIFGGETTVEVRGSGLGGRNTELALRVAMGAENRLARGWVFMSGGTDGRDGPTDAAGAIVDSNTVARIKAAGGNPASLLKDNDSYNALRLSGDLLITGGTGTNVADVQVFIRSQCGAFED